MDHRAEALLGETEIIFEVKKEVWGEGSNVALLHVKDTRLHLSFWLLGDSPCPMKGDCAPKLATNFLFQRLGLIKDVTPTQRTLPAWLVSSGEGAVGAGAELELGRVGQGCCCCAGGGGPARSGAEGGLGRVAGVPWQGPGGAAGRGQVPRGAGGGRAGGAGRGAAGMLLNKLLP